MPFTKIGPNKYKSPSGRKFTKRQVRAYYATRGFRRKTRDAQFFCDAPLQPSGDPTGTADIRRRYGALAGMKFRRLRTILFNAIVQQDILGLKPQTVSPLALAGAAGNMQLGFQTWLDSTLKKVVVENDGAWLRPMIASAYVRAINRGMRLSKPVGPENQDQSNMISSLHALAVIELQGVCEAVSQRVMRAVNIALIHGQSHRAAFEDMDKALRVIGMARTKTMIELMVVKAHSTGTLDQFEVAGVSRVGVVPEVKLLQDAPRRGTGPGSRTSKEEPPSRRTVQRIRRAQRRVEQFQMVNVETAGDDDVCDECEDIESGGPYTIDEARSLIPAHPNCRCAFVPVDEPDEWEMGFE